MARLTTEDFIIKARQVHGDKYDYSKVEYVNAKGKVIIICPEHGEFIQSPTKHYGGQGCPKCVNNVIVNLMPYEKLKELVRSLGIKRQWQYTEWWRKNEEYCRRNGIPATPYEVYSK